MAEKKKTEMSSTEKVGVGVGVGLTAAAVAAAGAFFLYGSKNAAKNRKAVKSWTLKAKAEILERLEDAKAMTKEEYEDLVNNVSASYAELKKASRVDLKGFKDEMKDHWKAIEKMATPPKKAVKKVVKKEAKKVVKKATAK